MPGVQPTKHAAASCGTSGHVHSDEGGLRLFTYVATWIATLYVNIVRGCNSVKSWSGWTRERGFESGRLEYRRAGRDGALRCVDATGYPQISQMYRREALRYLPPLPAKSRQIGLSPPGGFWGASPQPYASLERCPDRIELHLPKPLN